MKRSIEFDPGIYQWEFTEDKIAISKWDKPPTSTMQWLGTDHRGYLEGNNNDDIRFVVVLKRRKFK